MINQGFTPGPWNNYQGDDIYCVYAESGKKICSIEPVDMVGWNAVHREEADANEALIAAAPDLLAALEAVDREHDLLLAMKSCIASRPQGVISIAVDDDEDAIAWRGYRDEAQKLVDARRAAIAKARGTPC